MKDYGISTYGDRVADVYDERAEVVQQDTESAVAFLAELASEGPVLELAIGTGRLALPLAERGIEVQGVDASERMVERLRAKPGGEAIPVAMGDFADVPVDGEFHLVFVAFNTLFALLSQEAQLRCFRNVAEHLAAGGAFAIEVFVPDLCRFDRGQRVDAMLVDTDAVDVNVARHYPSEQRIESQHVRASESG